MTASLMKVRVKCDCGVEFSNSILSSDRDESEVREFCVNHAGHGCSIIQTVEHAPAAADALRAMVLDWIDGKKSIADIFEEGAATLRSMENN